MDHWGEDHAKVTAEAVCQQLDVMLSLGASVNMYMYYGGTDFGYFSGANGDLDLWFVSDPTSYDYDAPISEAGDVTYKYSQILEVIKKYRPDIPVYPVANLTKRSCGEVSFSQINPSDIFSFSIRKNNELETPFREQNCPWTELWELSKF
jgi:hypothetical protein